ncbi:RebB family R body protein [Chromobacterium alticapitis]|uniref:R body protein RebB-like protein n=1 Tax=Chromobacterium alticapitis TaxID=2073169 RepID=A0A2S5DG60_9NEIS|nr:RebB family R body protein [Chromobacterium alticapitis]POZ61988.1 R body protein RebB-like protein [Chromobacterium alticapitis]
MAFPTAVNDQITDAIAQANVKVVAEAPAMAMGAIYQTMAHSAGILFENAVSSQQQMTALAQSMANMGVMQIYSLDTPPSGLALAGVPDNLSSLLAVLQAFRVRAGT